MTVERYLLLDANLLAGYSAPQTLTCDNAEETRSRIETVVESIRCGCSPHLRLLVPEICVAETQTVLSKHANPKWKGAVRKKDDTKSIHGKSYASLQEKMTADLHGGNLIESIPLQRYHVLAKHLITPIDHQTHIMPRQKGQRPRELGGTDQLICGMAFWLHRFLGPERLVVVTADYRMAKVLEKARKLKASQLENWGVQEAAKRAFDATVTHDAFPPVLYLPTATEKQLRASLNAWPLPLKKSKVAPSAAPPTKEQIETLVDLYKAIGIGRDNLPYSPQLRELARQFADATGRQLCDKQLWEVLIKRLKAGDGKTKPAKGATQ
jgi:hypothetical protein